MNCFDLGLPELQCVLQHNWKKNLVFSIRKKYLCHFPTLKGSSELLWYILGILRDLVAKKNRKKLRKNCEKKFKKTFVKTFVKTKHFRKNETFL